MILRDAQDTDFAESVNHREMKAKDGGSKPSIKAMLGVLLHTDDV